ncbi:hypothetical protein CYMTET_19283 [Cymbomonas tetramitiformis]|uniref:ATP-dependent DNA helicase n=1 Tax=Cymbomonas tetramitiformis TaxID=36881 RepID=A0AAE0G7P9_9CHLO|nr:hypothetical protein CYMTET_56258 [Cymbomonas tetramitiformis]KAK3272421.1 hypothetical protein CYMTET_19283 [Cymbomonas tetramitiformis]
MITDNNSIAQKFMTFGQTILRALDTAPQIRIEVHTDISNKKVQKELRAQRPQESSHPHRYGELLVDDIMLLKDDDPTHDATRSLVMTKQQGGLQILPALHPLADAMAYPLMFPYGTVGWDRYMLRYKPKSSSNELTDKRLTMLDYYRFHVQRRDPLHVHLYGRLFQQWVTDAWSKVDDSHLQYLQEKSFQTHYRAIVAAGAMDACRKSDDTEDCSKMGTPVTTYLPSSHENSPRFLYEKLQDTMTYNREWGNPDLFLTFTSNREWPEVQAAIRSQGCPDHSTHDNFDLIVRAFVMRFDVFMKYLMHKDGSHYGKAHAASWVVEFQPHSGLPHAHVMLWLEKKLTVETIDRYIWAEIPDKTKYPRLYEEVKKVVHGPCGNAYPDRACTSTTPDGVAVCEKGFPQPFTADLPAKELERKIDSGELNLQTGIELTAFFDCNKKGSKTYDEKAGSLLYTDMPKEFTFDKQKKEWHRRVQKWRTSLGRMYFVNPKCEERFYLRLMLTHIRGPTSYEDVRTVDGRTYTTFHEAAIACGLAQNDQEYVICLHEAEILYPARMVRNLFITIVAHCQPGKPQELWEQFKTSMSADKLYGIQQQPLKLELPQQEQLAIVKAYDDIVTALKFMHIEEIPGVARPEPPHVSDPQRSQTVLEYFSNDIALNHKLSETRFSEMYHSPLMNAKQRAFVDAVIMATTTNTTSRMFFLHAPAGTGKTFVLNMLLHWFRSQQKLTMPMCSLGIGALSLLNGRTMHSWMSAPVIDLTRPCAIQSHGEMGDFIRKLHQVTWDEMLKMPRTLLEKVDDALRDCRSHQKDEPMAGLIFIGAGDSRQPAPIIAHSCFAQIQSLTMPNSQLWPNFHVFELTENIRLQVMLQNKDVSPEKVERHGRWAKELLTIGDGTAPTLPNTNRIRLSDEMCVDTREELIDFVYGDLDTRWSDTRYLTDRVILAPHIRTAYRRITCD